MVDLEKPNPEDYANLLASFAAMELLENLTALGDRALDRRKTMDVSDVPEKIIAEAREIIGTFLLDRLSEMNGDSTQPADNEAFLKALEKEVVQIGEKLPYKIESNIVQRVITQEIGKN